MKLYMVKLDWACPDEYGDVEIYLFRNYKKAMKKFISLIKQELDPKVSWVGDIRWNKGQPIGNYEFSQICPNHKLKSDAFWHITDMSDWFKHSYIDLISIMTM